MCSHVRFQAQMASKPFFSIVMLLFLLLTSCVSHDAGVYSTSTESQLKMDNLIAETLKRVDVYGNSFSSEKRLLWVDSLLLQTTDPVKKLELQYNKAAILLENGMETQAVDLYESLQEAFTRTPQTALNYYLNLGTAYLRLAERNSCIMGHNADACTMPLRGLGIHQDKAPARLAIRAFQKVLEIDPKDYDALWLLNISYMVIGEYPTGIPKAWLIPGLDAPGEKMNAFISMAPDLGIGINCVSGGSVVEDFNNDGYPDILTSSFLLSESLYLYLNKGDGSFTDVTKSSGMDRCAGGLNLTSTDYNNDGFIDVFVLRGAWQGFGGNYGEQPNSLLKNNGDGTFTDVTFEAGLVSLKPGQTATWNDFNNDGWLDVFIAYESTTMDQYPCELFINNSDGTFTDKAPDWGIDFGAFIKGVASGDYDNDGWPDLFFSTLNGEKMLVKNHGLQNGKLVFENVTERAGLVGEKYRSFPTWFFDYNNDGWLDIFVCNYEYERPLSYYFAKEALHPSREGTGKPRIYQNNGNGTFTNVSDKLQLNQPAFAMGANFGDIDNDGWLDFYLATGNPNYRSLIPNKLFRNIGGKRFVDVTNSSRTGNLQKGHGVSFGDLDNDGDQDLYVQMGGAYKGDHYPNLFYLNPGQKEGNNSIYFKLQGSKTNRSAIGARVAVVFTENGKQRIVYREVTTGGSFGCSPLRVEMGIGQATKVDNVVVFWPASRQLQTFNVTLEANKLYLLEEGQPKAKPLPLNKVVFKHADGSIPMCAPQQ